MATAAKGIKTIGILGGSSDKATADYYRLLNQAVNRRLGGWNTAELLVSSMNFARAEYYVRNGLWQEAGADLARRAAALERAGADLLICVSNTLHRTAEIFAAAVRIPFLHIADPTGEAIRAAGLRRVALLGTRPSMEMDFLKNRYRERFGIEAVAPEAEDRILLDRIIFDELCRGEVKAASKAEYLRVIDELASRGAAGVILGCTEIRLAISQTDRPNLPMFDTLELHVDAAVEAALAEGNGRAR